MRFAAGPCLTCGAPVGDERLNGGARRSLYCTDDCMLARRSHGALVARPAELELLDRGVGCSVPRCIAQADGWLTSAGSWDGPYCLACFELVLDRLEALALAPQLAAVLPQLEAASSVPT